MNPTSRGSNKDPKEPDDLQSFLASSLKTSGHPAMPGKTNHHPDQSDQSEDPEVYEVPSSVSEEQRRIRVHTVEGTDIRGFLYLEGTSFERRVSTVMNDSRTFIALTDIEIFIKGRRVSRADFICVNKSSIAYVMEDGDIPPHYGS